MTRRVNEVEMEQDVAENLKRFMSKVTPESKPKPKNKILLDEDISEDQTLFMPNDPAMFENNDEEEIDLPVETQAFRKETSEGLKFNSSTKFLKDNKARSKNPLSTYFREPGIFLKLPSQGNFSADGDVEFTVNGEIPVYPMTAKDEVWFKNPDALLNGHAIQKVLESCCPGLHNIRDLPINDINVLLLGLRYSSYGKTLKLKAKCPHCKTENTFSVDIDDLLSSIDFLEAEYTILLDNGLKLYIKPYTYDSMIKVTIVTFEEAKVLQLLQNESMPEEEKKEAIRNAFIKINDLMIHVMARAIYKIITPDNKTVKDQENIEEWLGEVDRKTFEILKNKFDEINEIGVPKNYHVTCVNPKCKKEFPVAISYDPASFFV